MMRYGSVCSGIEAASVAWHGLGWQPAWFSEIEAFPSAVLAHRWPGVTNRGDMTKLPAAILAGEIEAPDLLVGGTPCQAFSVAGQRRSLDDARGNLTLTFVELADAIGTVRRAAGRPGPIILWENVPGVLNTKDNAFGCFLGGLAGADEELRPVGRKWPRAGVVHGPRRRVAWCVLDAQYFGVAQRRRRVFVVAVPNELVEHLGDRAHPAEILSIGKSLRRDTPTRGQAGQGAAAGFETGPGGNRFTDLAPTLDCRAKNGPMQNQVGAGVIAPKIAMTLDRKSNVDEAHGVMIAHTLRANHDASEDGTGRGTPLVPVARPIPINTMVGLRHKALGEGTGLGIGKPGDPANTLSKAHSHAVAQPIAFKIRGGSETDTGSQGSLTPGRAAGKGFLGSEERAFTVGATQDQFLAAPVYGIDNENNGFRADGPCGPLMRDSPSGGGRPLPAVLTPTYAVRRLTPRECERLQGFPDDYTAIPYRGKSAADGPRYKALGNSMAVPCMAWLGHRIADAFSSPEA